jgi:hypothetical protein
MQELSKFCDMLSETNLLFHGFTFSEVCFTVIVYGTFSFVRYGTKDSCRHSCSCCLINNILLRILWNICDVSVTSFACLTVAVREPSPTNRKPKKLFAWPPSWFFIITKVTRTFNVFNYTAFQYTKIDVVSVSAKFNFAHLLRCY